MFIHVTELAYRHRHATVVEAGDCEEELVQMLREYEAEQAVERHLETNDRVREETDREAALGLL